MKILTAAEMAATDKQSVEQGVPVAVLMENAGAAVARFCLRRFPGDGLVVAICGKGNNGGDGFVAARHMAEAGRRVRVALLGTASELKGDAADAFATMKKQSGVEVRETGNESALRAALAGAELVLDAVVGTGFKPPLRGLAVVARDLLAKMNAPVVAVDLPSGWDADSMMLSAEGAFRADAVVTFVAPKLAHVFGHLTTGRRLGRWWWRRLERRRLRFNRRADCTGRVQRRRWRRRRATSTATKASSGMCCWWAVRSARRERRRCRAWQRCARARGW